MANGGIQLTEKSGIPRVIEALEANDWAQPDEPMLSELETASEATQDHDDEFDADNLDFGFEKADMQGLRMAIWGMGDAHPPVSSSSSAAAAAAINGIEESTNLPETAAIGDAQQQQQQQQLTEDDIVKVEGMMRRLQAARDAGQGMSEAQRRAFAAKAVSEVMKDL